MRAWNASVFSGAGAPQRSEAHEEDGKRAFPCTLCGETMPLWQRIPSDAWRNRPILRVDVHWCSACQCGAVMPTPSWAAVARYYQFDGYYTHGARPQSASLRRSLADRLRVRLAWWLDRGTPMTAEFVHESLGGSPGLRICDLGCGSGELGAQLTRLGHQVVGVEVDPGAASRRGEVTFEVHAGTAEALPLQLRQRRFDAVVLSHVLEHCRDPLRVLRNVHDLLVPGGTLLCEVPNNASAGLRFSGGAWSMFDVPRHLHFFTPRSLRRACESAQLQVQRTYFAHYTRQFTNEWIEKEQTLWDNLNGFSALPVPRPVRNSRARAWKLLLRTAISSRQRKYDCVGVIAKAGV